MALPTKADFLANLPFVSQPEDDDCRICYEPFEVQPVYSHGGDLSDEVGHRAVQTPCNHILGEACLARSLERVAWCPMCRQDLCQPGEDASEDNVASGEHDLAAEAEEERLVVEQELQDLGLELDAEDLQNREQLANLITSLASARLAPSRDAQEIVRLESSISALNHARLLDYRSGALDVNNRHFRAPLSVQSVMDDSILSSAQEQETHIINAAETKKQLLWYFSLTLSSAVADLRRAQSRYRLRNPSYKGIRHGRVGTMLHPAAMHVVDCMIEMLGSVDGQACDAVQLRRDVMRGLRERVDREDPHGLECVMVDVVEIAAVCLCGRAVRVWAMGEWRGYGEDDVLV